MVSKAGKAKVREATRKTLAERDRTYKGKRKKGKGRSAPSLGSGMAEKAKRKVQGRKSRLDSAIRRAGG